MCVCVSEENGMYIKKDRWIYLCVCVCGNLCGKLQLISIC